MSGEEIDELAEEGRAPQCASCEYAARQDALWPENVEAWGIYRSLCGRTVGLLELQGWMFLAQTEGWSIEDRLALLARLDVIHAVLSPPERTATKDRDA